VQPTLLYIPPPPLPVFLPCLYTHLYYLLIYPSISSRLLLSPPPQAQCHPACRWSCDDPVCPAVCHPICERPRCQMQCEKTSCAQCTVHCDRPVCSVRCPKEMCEKESCPSCETVCAPAQCHTKCTAPQPVCSPVCEETKCQWKCRKPSLCPKPKCELACEKPACEYKDKSSGCCPCAQNPGGVNSAMQGANSLLEEEMHADMRPSFMEVMSSLTHREQRGMATCCPCA
jgi:hypothetical protein